VLSSNLVPAQIDDFPGPEPVPEGQKHHQSVAVTIAIGLGCLDQPLDLIDG